MTRTFKVAAVTAALLMLAGCGTERVVSKTYTPGYTVQQRQSCGDGCTTTVPVPYPECWGVQLDDHRQLCVTEQEWRRIEVGQVFDPEADQ